MNDELFPTATVTQLSPRLLWMKKHQVITWRLPSTGEWLAGFVAGPNYAKIAASDTESSQWFMDQIGEHGDNSIGIADTEEDAIGELMKTWYAVANKIKLWNEEVSK